MLALIMTVAALAGAGPPAAAGGLGDAQLVGQRLVAGFEGGSVPAEVRRRIAAGRLGGVILFDSNFDTRADARALIAELQSIDRPRGLRDPLLVMVDQEGGLVKRLPGPPTLSAEQMGAAGRSTCRRQGKATGRMLRRTGVNVDLAPVLDVARPGSVMDDENRSFGSDPELVAACGGAFAAALERNGVAPTAKHFPGLGAARLNTDAAVQRIDLSRSRLRRVDEAPYRRFGQGGARGRLVMMSSAIYPEFSDRPAAFARSLATRELRGRLGFRGVSITDALETASTEAIGGPTRAAKLAARAGTDLLLFAGFDAAKRAAKALRPMAGRDGFRDSVERVLALRGRLSG
jgi:beta-N-acetylhexosaminidase